MWLVHLMSIIKWLANWLAQELLFLLHGTRSCDLVPLLENNTQTMGKIFLTCVQMATLARLPNDVLTARDERPKPENRVEKAVVRVILGLSSATTTQLRTQVKLTPLACEERKTNPIILDQYNITVSGRIGERAEAIAKWPLRAVDSNADKNELLQGQQIDAI